MSEIENLDALEAEIAELETTLGGAAALGAAFNRELVSMRDAMTWTAAEANGLSRSFGTGFKRAFDGLVFDGMRASDALKMVGRSIIDNVYNAAMRPVQNAVGGLVSDAINNVSSSILPFAAGATFSQGRVMPFAKGGVVGAPTYFPMRGATGLMGEAGPEAILPLARGADGRLGVQAATGRAVSVVMNIQTRDAESFRRSQSQIAAEVNRALARGQRNS